jgi:hypothetical protein
MQDYQCSECERIISAVLPLKRKLPTPHFTFTGPMQHPSEAISVERRRECRGVWKPKGKQRVEGVDDESPGTTP